MSSLSTFPEATSLNTIFKHSINLDGHGSRRSFKAQFLGRRNIEIVKKMVAINSALQKVLKPQIPQGYLKSFYLYNFQQLTLYY